MTAETLPREGLRKTAVTAEIRKTLNLQREYLDAVARADRANVPDSDIPGGAGLTQLFLTFTDYALDRVQDTPSEVMLPIEEPTHTFPSYARAALSHIYARSTFPKYTQQYFEPNTHTLYTITDSTEKLYAADAPFVPDSKEYMGLGQFRKEARSGKHDRAGSYEFDREAMIAAYYQAPFNVEAAHVDGTVRTLPPWDIRKLFYRVSELRRTVSYDTLDVSLDTALHQALDKAEETVESAQHTYRHSFQYSIQSLTRAIEGGSHALLHSEIETKTLYEGKPVIFLPRLGRLATRGDDKKFTDVPHDLYFRDIGAAIFYLVGKVNQQYVPHELREN
ncbi:MAG: hypothetical protein HYV40_06085 [Candidatus Levybacteria bacterium]|nr:hypothetical protein [Candidatus Levybacteria bacterium]